MGVWNWIKRWGMYIPVVVLNVLLIILLIIARPSWQFAAPVIIYCLSVFAITILTIISIWKQSNLVRNIAMGILLVLILLPPSLAIINQIIESNHTCGRDMLCAPEPDIPATLQDQIFMPVDALTITKGKQFVFSVNVYNEEFAGPVMGKFTCPSTDAAEGFSICSPPQEIPSGEDKGYRFIIGKEDVQQISNRTCRLYFFETDAASIADCDSLEPRPDSAMRYLDIPVTIR